MNNFHNKVVLSVAPSSVDFRSSMLGLDVLGSSREIITVGSKERIDSKVSTVMGKIYFSNTTGFRHIDTLLTESIFSFLFINCLHLLSY